MLRFPFPHLTSILEPVPEVASSTDHGKPHEKEEQ
jgi:hypothetical protein